MIGLRHTRIITEKITEISEYCLHYKSMCTKYKERTTSIVVMKPQVSLEQVASVTSLKWIVNHLRNNE